MNKKLRAVFYASASGREPVKDYFKKELCTHEQQEIYTSIRTIQHSWPIGKPHVDHIKDNIWEIRCRHRNKITRVLFVIIKNKMVLLHGFTKKTQKTPPQDIKLAKKRLKDYEKQA